MKPEGDRKVLIINCTINHAFLGENAQVSATSATFLLLNSIPHVIMPSIFLLNVNMRTPNHLPIIQTHSLSLCTESLTVKQILCEFAIKCFPKMLYKVS